MPKNSSKRGGAPLYYSMDAQTIETLGRFVSGIKLILIAIMVAALAVTIWGWVDHSGLEYKTVHLGLRDDNSVKCRNALGPRRLNDGDDNDDYCILAEYYGDIKYWMMAFIFEIVVLAGLVITSLDIRPSDQNVSGDVVTDEWTGVYSRFVGVGGVVRSLGYYDADYHFWLCRIVTDFYIGMSVMLNIGGLDIIYALFAGGLMSAYAFCGFIREMAHATHMFDDDNMWWNKNMSRPWAHLPQFFFLGLVYITSFVTLYREFVEHNDLRTVVAFSFWFTLAYYVAEQVVGAAWILFRSRYGTKGEGAMHSARKWVVAVHWISYFVFFTVMCIAPGRMMNDFRYAI